MSGTGSSLASFLIAHARNTPDCIYIHAPTGAITYARALAIASGLAAHLTSLPRVGDKKSVAVAIETPELLVHAIWASILGGINVVFVPRISDPETMRRTLSEANVELVLSDESSLDGHPWFLDIREAMRKVSAVPYRQASGLEEPDESPGNEPAFIFQTSGTSGVPKWVRCEFSKCARAVEAMHSVGALDHARAQSVFLTPPLYHSYGLSAFLEYTSVGGTVVFPPNVSPFGPAGDLQKLAVRERVNAIEGVPYFYFQLAKLANRVALPALRHIGFGGGSLDRTVVEQLLTAFPGITVSVRYGLTETPSVVTHKVFRPPYQEDWRSSGRVIPAYRMQIVGPEGRTLGPGVQGEIVVSGGCVCAYRGEQGDTLQTGDLGYLTDAGELFIAGRKSSYLKNRGFRISPEQIESVIGHFQGVRDCRVLMNDSKLVAEVVCENDTSLHELPVYVNRQLPAYAVPDQVIRVPAIPRTASGKIKRH